ncbi:MAG: VIT1/CCC1 transporter family protein [Candidatus Odinarchaeota archaeon]
MSSEENNSGRKSTVNKLREYLAISGVGEIARRYFVMNAFDGVLTTLGVIIGASSTSSINTFFIISAVLGGAIAMAVSGVSGAYMAEKAEREREFGELKKALISDLKGSIHEKALKFASLYVAVVDGAAPFISSIIVLSPFFVAHIGLIPPLIALIMSIIVTTIFLFTLGSYLAKISKTNILISGLKMVLAGVITAVIIFLVSLL